MKPHITPCSPPSSEESGAPLPSSFSLGFLADTPTLGLRVDPTTSPGPDLKVILHAPRPPAPGRATGTARQPGRWGFSALKK